MIATKSAAFADVLLVSFGYAIHLVKRTGPPAVVGPPIKKNLVRGNGLQRRAAPKILRENDASPIAQKTNRVRESFIMFMSCWGRLDIDTVSSDMWVNVPRSRFCRGRDRNCSFAGFVNPEASRTTNLVNHDLIIRYGDETGALGDYVIGDLHFSCQELKDIQFSLGLVSSSR